MGIMSNQVASPPAVSSTTSSGPISVAIIEDHREFRDYLTALISGTEGFDCTGSFRSIEDALPKINAHAPHVILMDIGLPGMNGIDGIRLFKERYPAILLLTLTIHDDDERIFDALCAGASGYLLKKTQPARLIGSDKEDLERGEAMS